MFHKNIYITIVSFLILLLLGVSVSTRDAFAGSEHNLRGFAWSSNFGWISFNSLDDPRAPASYGVNRNNDGTLSGAAWSSSIGWIKFDPNLFGPDFRQGARILWASDDGDGIKEIEGWALACSAFVTGDCQGALRDTDWDGWIKFGPNFPLFYATVKDNKFFSGALWGSFLLGWIDIGGVVEGIPSVQPIQVLLRAKKGTANSTIDEYKDATVRPRIDLSNSEAVSVGTTIQWQATGPTVNCNPPQYRRNNATSWTTLANVSDSTNGLRHLNNTSSSGGGSGPRLNSNATLMVRYVCFDTAGGVTKPLPQKTITIVTGPGGGGSCTSNPLPTPNPFIQGVKQVAYSYAENNCTHVVSVTCTDNKYELIGGSTNPDAECRLRVGDTPGESGNANYEEF